MHLIKSGSKYYTVKSGTKNYLWDGDYLIENGQLKWCNPNIYLDLTDFASGTGLKINTGIIPTQNTTYEVVARTVAVSGTANDHCPFVILNPLNNYEFGVWAYPNSNFRVAYDTGWKNTSVKCNLNEKFKVASRINNNKYIINVNGTDYEYNITDKQTDMPLFLGCWNHGYSNGNPPIPYYYYNGKIYLFKLYESGILSMYLVPVPLGMQIGNFTVPSNGMFDIVTQSFFTGSGSGTFTYGKDE